MKEKAKKSLSSKKIAAQKPQTEESGLPESLDTELSEINTDEQSAKTDKNVKTAVQSAAAAAPLTQDFLAYELKKSRHTWRIVVLALILSLLAGLGGGIVGGVYLEPLLKLNFSGNQPSSEVRKVTLDESSAIIEVVKEVNPAVVSIIVSKDLQKYEQYYGSPFGDLFFLPNTIPHGGSGLQQIGAGSGFIVTTDGLIITNKHVVADNNAEYTVILTSGKKYSGKVVALDPLNDLAVIKIEATDLPTVSLGDASKVELGQRVIAIGNTLGELSNTVTAGIISGIGRTVSASDSAGSLEQLQEVFQTDAAINPGNSGGPLLNLAGQVIGVNTAVDQSGQLVGFAIPSSEVQKVLADVLKYGRVLRPFVGVRYLIITSDYAKANKLKVDHGALILRGVATKEPAIVAGSPAEKAGLQENDIILEVNGKRVDEKNTLSVVLKEFKPGDQVALKIQRGDEIKNVLLTLGEAQ